MPLPRFWLRIRRSVHFRLRAGRVYYGGQTSAKVSAHIVLCVDNGLSAQASSSTSDSNNKESHAVHARAVARCTQLGLVAVFPLQILRSTVQAAGQAHCCVPSCVSSRARTTHPRVFDSGPTWRAPWRWTTARGQRLPRTSFDFWDFPPGELSARARPPSRRRTTGRSRTIATEPRRLWNAPKMAEAELEGHWAKCGGLGKTEESGGGEGAGRLGQADAGSAADDDANDAPARSRTLPPSRGHLLRDVQRCGGSRMPAPPASHGGELVGTVCAGEGHLLPEGDHDVVLAQAAAARSWRRPRRTTP